MKKIKLLLFSGLLALAFSASGQTVSIQNTTSALPVGTNIELGYSFTGCPAPLINIPTPYVNPAVSICTPIISINGVQISFIDNTCSPSLAVTFYLTPSSYSYMNCGGTGVVTFTLDFNGDLTIN